MKDHFSKIGFVLSVAGGAVGLGNAWKFPTMVGTNGGFAFVLLYLLITLTIGFAIFLAEILMGKLSRKDPVNAYLSLSPTPKKGKIWKNAGFFTIGGILVLSFYLVILGWVIRYIFVSLTALPKDINSARAMFEGFVSGDILGSIFFFFIGFAITLFVVSKGVKNGIEKLNVWMMPLLFVMLLGMLIFSSTIDGFKDAAKFLFYMDFSKLNFSVMLDALGLSFFTLCVGIGCIMTYAASMSDETNPIASSLYIVLINILIAFMMGLIVFTFIFEFNGDPTEQGVGLVFFSLLTLFSNFGIVGNLLAFLFFVSLFFAGITSAISMIEPFTFYLVSEYKISRKKALVYIGLAVFILGCLSILSISAKFSGLLTFFGKSFFDCLDFLTSNVTLPLGALLTAVFVGYVMRSELVRGYFEPYMGKCVFKVWFFVLKFVAPFAIVAIVLNQILG
ncbi:sodium-dependent transporter [Campylobacter corcagiensis]|uniref:Sodium-dependent transporter n=1 Tax=Campylobacter corcagiensis TaxID=1448857 RepID=A0A7M1LFJ7_9BACT|nr:sodium-dependent transporter [Campylobacter corcagiensis]QKF64469.1 sodium-dependent transporter, SNF family [Campylobacter corcagiensis]QOQ87347.1 sodium-dependent transporter [Campylobacter corcagiensis]